MSGVYLIHLAPARWILFPRSCAMPTFSQLLSCADPGIFVGVGGGVPGQSDKKSFDNVFYFSSPQLTLQKSNG